MNIIDEARRILEEAGYSTIAKSSSDSSFYFEDESLLGFVRLHETIDDLLNTWEKHQDVFLRENALPLQSEPQKAWNVYSVYISQEKCHDSKRNELSKISEDFRGTRKIIHDGVNKKSDLVNALLPLLPIQNYVSFGQEDIYERLRKSLETESKSLTTLFEKYEIRELAKIILQEE